MTVQPTFLRYLRMAKEATWGTSPALIANEFNAAGVNYSFITTSPLGALKQVQLKHRTQGATGKRTKDQHAPFSGMEHAEGQLDIPFVPTYGGLLLTAALGTDSPTDTTDATLKSSTALSASPQTISVWTAQPTSGKYDYLKMAFTLTAGAAFGAGAAVVIVGTDANDAVITETVTFGVQSSAFTVYSQLSYKTVTSAVITGVTLGGGSGTITIDGIQYTTHVITCNDTPLSLAIEEFDDPSAGSGKSFVYNGMTMTNLTVAFSVLQEDSILMLQPSFQGKFPVATTQTANALTPLRAWPSWTASLTKGGSAYARVQSANVQITPGARLYRSAVNSRSPQGVVPLEREIRVSGQLYLEDSTEYDAWVNNSVGNYVLTFTSPFKVGTSTYQSLQLDFTQWYFEVLNPKEDNGMVVADFEAFTTEHATNNAIKATLVNTKNGAY